MFLILEIPAALPSNLSAANSATNSPSLLLHTLSVHGSDTEASVWIGYYLCDI